MARYSEQHKEATRLRIVGQAGRRLKRDGIDGSGIATLMSDAGLTNGAFYAHFSSKDDLVGAVISDQLSSQRKKSGAGMSDRAAFEQFVRDYLSTKHRDNPEEGCPSAALLGDIGRGTKGTKRAYTDGLLPIVDNIAALIGEPDPGTARVRALGVLASMVGTLQLSRALTNRRLAKEVLAQGVVNTLRLL